VGVEARRVPRVDAEGVDTEAADPPTASRGIRPWRRSKARTSSTVTTVSGSRAARAEMSMTTAGTISSDSSSSGASRPPLRLLARREGREGRRQRVGEVDQAVSPAREVATCADLRIHRPMCPIRRFPVVVLLVAGLVAVAWPVAAAPADAPAGRARQLERVARDLAVRLRAVPARDGDFADPGRYCPADRLAVSWAPPAGAFRFGAYIPPLGPAPGPATTSVNGGGHLPWRDLCVHGVRGPLDHRRLAGRRRAGPGPPPAPPSGRPARARPRRRRPPPSRPPGPGRCTTAPPTSPRPPAALGPSRAWSVPADRPGLVPGHPRLGHLTGLLDRRPQRAQGGPGLGLGGDGDGEQPLPPRRRPPGLQLAAPGRPERPPLRHGPASGRDAHHPRPPHLGVLPGHRGLAPVRRRQPPHRPRPLQLQLGRRPQTDQLVGRHPGTYGSPT
jgi:hypothetical protein